MSNIEKAFATLLALGIVGCMLATAAQWLMRPPAYLMYRHPVVRNGAVSEAPSVQTKPSRAHKPIRMSTSGTLHVTPAMPHEIDLLGD